ncbi:hypothetical protein CSA80_02635 [Candidatus Saccharibacteria bacterium]|nr:MAG: hypothetical protein CR973_02750 [Candidatus Saccharibacteria bacterium]PID98993.1 MAG: hypothetical protein CSA80_02635 [Candidatus Saccharibacteria bacterium]
MTKNLRPYDMTLTDSDGIRRRRRRRLLLRSLLPVICVVVLALWLALPWFTTTMAQNAINDNRPETAQSWLSLGRINTVFEPYKHPFNRGIAAAHAKQYDKAFDEFQEALASAPDDQVCLIHQQIVITSELAGDDALSRQDAAQAIVYYIKAIASVVAHPQCFKGNGNGGKSGLEDKLAAATRAAEQSSSDSDEQQSDQNPSDSSPPSDDQLDKAEQLEQEGRINKQSSDQRRQGGGNSSRVPKPW